ncbi:DUF1501 domain-containing protein [Lacipirellula limnantheis]|uniref:Sulfatase n=1 Tax=Lacipirellula limnantheis TaxID=2528024 RepID=A0A517TSZ4_9BACT|nr:DUF1501 domain-containing protein [Lacipirellula limnantheis]QDT71500.1 hypothetical protein I41_06580 [Lacipirellula limnantheis]
MDSSRLSIGAEQAQRQMTRRYLLGRTAGYLGAAAFASLGGRGARAALSSSPPAQGLGLGGLPHFPPTAKRVIYLFQSGGPSHVDLFDYHPRLRELHGTELPDSIRQGQRITGMTSGQSNFPVVAPMFKFARHGQVGTWVSELLPHTAKIVDELTIVKSLHTEAINHDPAITFINTGTQQLGKPSMGAWLSYGLGCETQNLPAYVVMVSKANRPNMQPLFARLWGSGFLPSSHQGVRFRAGKDPVLYLSNPPGVSPDRRRSMLDSLAALNEIQFQQSQDPETETRIQQYEMAYRMQTSVPELMDLSDESDQTFKLYGESARRPGTFAANCLLARRLAERGVRFIQLFHRDWDQHFRLPRDIAEQCRDTDQASAGLVMDLKERGLLDDTLVIWGGEFGRTIYSQGALTATDHGRDHHGRCFSAWMAGGGVRAGYEHGETDDYCYNIVRDPVHINDLNATILHTMGIDHERFTFPYQGLDQRLTGVEGARVEPRLLR